MGDYSEDLLNLPLPIMESTVNTNADLEDWTKGVVYEGVDIDICGSSHHDLLNHSHNQSTRMINDDPIPLTAPASLTAAVMGSPTQQTLSQLQSQAQAQSQSQLQLQQRVQHVQQQQQQRIQQLQQLQQVQQQVQQQQFTHHQPPPVPVLVHPLQQQQLLQP